MEIGGFKLDLWTLWGLMAQMVFFLSFLFQWIVSERKKKSVIPLEFWTLRIIGSVMLIIYVWERRDVVFLVSLILQIFIYTRNISLIKNESERR